MKILYTTDIHGVIWKYEKIFEEAKGLNVDVVINGGDMLPFKGNLLHQDKFIVNFLDDYFYQFNSLKIYFICLLGNDDLIIHDKLFQDVCDRYSYVIEIAQKRCQVKNYEYEFIGMNWVTDLPFGLKDRARMDNNDFKIPKQIGKAYISTFNGWIKIDDWASYIKSLPTIEEEISRLIKPINKSKAIYIIHQPPSNLGLDVCHDGRKVGSYSIYKFLLKSQPLLSLHGHIHESPEISGNWCSKIKNTISIQPGQSSQNENYLIYVFLDLKKMKFMRQIIDKQGKPLL